MIEMKDELKARTSDRALAEKVCFAMARAPYMADVAVTEVKRFGWFIECACDDRAKALGRMEVLLGKTRYNRVDWM